MYMGFGLTGAGARHTNRDTWPDIIPGLKQLRVLAGSFRDNQPVRMVNQKRSFSDISFCINPWMSMHLQTGATQFDAQFRVISLPCERRKMIRPLWNLLTGREVGEREDAFRFVTYTPVLGHVDGENPEEFSPGTRMSIEWGAPILLLTHMSSPP